MHGATSYIGTRNAIFTMSLDRIVTGPAHESLALDGNRI